MSFVQAPPPPSVDAAWAAFERNKRDRIARDWANAHATVGVDPEVMAFEMWSLDQSHQWGAIYNVDYQDRESIRRREYAMACWRIWTRSGEVAHDPCAALYNGRIHGCPWGIVTPVSDIVQCIAEIGGRKIWSTPGRSWHSVWMELDTTGPGGGAALVPDGLGGLTNRVRRKNAPPETPGWGDVKASVLARQGAAIAEIESIVRIVKEAR